MSRRLAALLLASCLIAPGAAAQTPAGHHTLAPLDGLQWRAGRNGVSTAIAEGDPAKGAFTMMLKLADGAWIPPHWHNVDKRLVVVSGTLRMGMGDRIDEAATTLLPAGGVAVVPAGSRHYEGGHGGETIVALVAQGPFTTTFVQ